MSRTESNDCPTWLGLIDKWTEGNKQTGELIAAWFGSVLTGIPLPDDAYRQVRDFLYDLGDRDPKAISIIFETLDMLKDYAKNPGPAEQIKNLRDEIDRINGERKQKESK